MKHTPAQGTRLKRLAATVARFLLPFLLGCAVTAGVFHANSYGVIKFALPFHHAKHSDSGNSAVVETCFRPAFRTQGKDSQWHFMKRIPATAQCTVRGFPIEELDAEFNFRRGFALNFTADVEDKTHLLPFLRAVHDPTLATRKRRVLLDLGGRDFGSSVGWFLRMYPLAFTEVIVFEAIKGRFRVPALSGLTCQKIELNTRSTVISKNCRNIPDDILSMVKVREQFVDVEDREGNATTPMTVNITRVIKEELGLTADDAVIMKMDIDWAEWPILPVWLKDKELPLIIDELFIEIHYEHPSMHGFHWTKPPSRDTAVRMLQDLRSAGYYTHAWP